MKKFEGILICTDLDGTLLSSKRSISKKNIEAIEYFKSEGGLFSFITGRMPFFVKEIYEAVKPNAPIGCINGGGIYDFVSERYLFTKPLEPSVADMISYVDKTMSDMGIQVNTFDKIYFCKDNSTMEEFRRITKMPNITKHYRNVDEPIAKILFGHENPLEIDRLAELLFSHPNAERYDFVRSEPNLYEILPKNTNKGTVLMTLSKLLDIDIKKTLALGDYDNDIELLKCAGLGIAVANASENAKKAADIITVDNDSDAVARVICDLESGRLGI